MWPKIIEFLGQDPSPAPGSLPERIVAIRKKFSFSQRGLARALGLEQSSVWHWEKGLHEPAAASWRVLAALLGHEPWDRPRTIGEAVIAYRRLKGWTQRELALELGVCHSTVCDWAPMDFAGPRTKTGLGPSRA